jgi:hypothetical protein
MAFFAADFEDSGVVGVVVITNKLVESEMSMFGCQLEVRPAREGV